MYRYVILSTLLVLLTGCVANKPMQLNEKHSYALNLAKAGGVKQSRDFNLSVDQQKAIQHQWDSVVDKDFRPRSVPNYAQIFGWLPESEAESKQLAMEVMSDTVVSAVEDALFTAGYEYRVDNRSFFQKISGEYGYEYLFSSIEIVDTNKGCPRLNQVNGDIDRTCYFSVVVVGPASSPRPIPEFVMPGTNGYPFLAKDGLEYSDIKLRKPDSSTLNELDLLTLVSEQMPKWMFISVPGHRQSDGSFTAPTVLSEGSKLLFAKP